MTWINGVEEQKKKLKKSLCLSAHYCQSDLLQMTQKPTHEGCFLQASSGIAAPLAVNKKIVSLQKYSHFV